MRRATRHEGHASHLGTHPAPIDQVHPSGSSWRRVYRVLFVYLWRFSTSMLAAALRQGAAAARAAARRARAGPSRQKVAASPRSVERVIFMKVNGPLRWNFGFDQQQPGGRKFLPNACWTMRDALWHPDGCAEGQDQTWFGILLLGACIPNGQIA